MNREGGCLLMVAIAIAIAIVPLPGELQAAPEWGRPNKEGIATRVVVLDEEHRVGKPMHFRIEGKNTGDKLVYADLQSLAHCWCLLSVVDAKGNEVQPIGATIAGCQTIQSYTPFPPGKVVSLVPQLDLSGEFAILKAGTYRLKYPGEQYAPPKFDLGEATDSVDGKTLDHTTTFTQLPASAVTTIEVKEGKLTAEQEMIRRLHGIVPKDWFLCRRWKDTGVTIGYHGEEAFVTIDLVAVDAKGGRPVEEGHRTLGRSALGEIRMGVSIGAGKGVGEPPEGRRLDDFWTGAEKTIRAALGVTGGRA